MRERWYRAKNPHPSACSCTECRGTHRVPKPNPALAETFNILNQSAATLSAAQQAARTGAQQNRQQKPVDPLAQYHADPVASESPADGVRPIEAHIKERTPRQLPPVSRKVVRVEEGGKVWYAEAPPVRSELHTFAAQPAQPKGWLRRLFRR